MSRSRAALSLATLLYLGMNIAVAAEPPHEELTLRLTPQTRELSGSAIIQLHTSGQVYLTIGSGFDVSDLTVDGQPVTSRSERVGEHQRWALALGKKPTPHRIRLRYRGKLEAVPETDHHGVLNGLPPMASERGSYLPGATGWYPAIEGHWFTYRVHLQLPADQRGLVPGRLVSETSADDSYRAEFAFDHAAEGIDLMAGPYSVKQREIAAASADSSARLRTYFDAEIAELADGYLDSAAQYLQRYSASIGPYPYSEFSIVSSVLPTGFGMPTLTYLGVDVLRLPFIRATSLGHEVLHNWWGNGVYVDWERGNWCEGLTTFMADYAYKEDQGEPAARDMRLDWLRDFAAVPEQRDQVLRAFTSRTHDASQIVGYNKAAFLFFMLRDELGAAVFDAGVRRFWQENQFRRASWADLQRAFDIASGRVLDVFFSQWLDRKGAPTVTVEDAVAEPSEGRYLVSVTLTQPPPTYRLKVPVRLTTDAGTEDKLLELKSNRQQFVFDIAARPRALTMDPEFRLFRRLHPKEIPPVLRQVTLDPVTVTVLASRGAAFEQNARALAARLMDSEPRFALATAIPADASAMIIGLGHDVDALLRRLRFPARPAAVATRGTAQVWTINRQNGKAVLVICAQDESALAALLRPLPHYGRQSWLVFEGAKAVDRGVWPSQALTWRFE